MVITNTAPEPTAIWTAGSYAKDALVLYLVSYGDYSVYHKWKSLVSSNNAVPGTDDTKWEDLGVCNKCAAFDRQISTATTATSSLTITLAPGLVNSIAFLGLVGSQLQVTMTDGAAGPTIYTRTIKLDDTIIVDWFDYFFEAFVPKTEVILTDLPLYGSGRITMVLTSGGTVEVGEIIFGSLYTLSDDALEHGASVGIIDYSRKDTDATTGVTTFTVRAYSKRMSGSFMVPNSTITQLQRVLADIRAVPSVYIGSDDSTYAPLVVYGFYRDFAIDIAYPTTSLCRIEVEGLT